jgi:hypothetical protein
VLEHLAKVLMAVLHQLHLVAIQHLAEVVQGQLV